VSLRRFPRSTLRGDRTVYRIHRAENAPWHFSRDGLGRFDPVDVQGMGCCYLASAALGAWVEVFRHPVLIDEADVRARRLLHVELGRDLRLADATSRRALQFGVTATIAAGDDYRASQAFAGEALQAGWHGVRCLVRHDPRQKLYGLALFGPAGAADPADPVWPSVPDDAIPDQLIAEAGRMFGYRVLPVP
jgi:hypothetical protein